VDTKKVGKDVKVYSEKEINRAWDRIRNLNTKGQYDEAAKLEAELTAAYIEGRVRM
jgi:curved DNA-binding protein CbpA